MDKDIYTLWLEDASAPGKSRQHGFHLGTDRVIAVETGWSVVKPKLERGDVISATLRAGGTTVASWDFRDLEDIEGDA